MDLVGSSRERTVRSAAALVLARGAVPDPRQDRAAGIATLDESTGFSLRRRFPAIVGPVSAAELCTALDGDGGAPSEGTYMSEGRKR